MCETFSLQIQKKIKIKKKEQDEKKNQAKEKESWNTIRSNFIVEFAL